MSRLQSQTTGVTQNDFADMVADKVERALAQYDEAINKSTVTSVGKIAGSVAAAISLLSPKHQRAIDAIHADLPGLASKFVRALAAEGARRSEAGLGGEASLPTTAGKPAPKNQRSQSDDLESMLIEDWAGRVAGSTYLEENLHIARSTLHRWQKRGEVVALRKGGRKHVFPLAQFVDGRPVAGIREVVSVIANPRLAWFWLTRPSDRLDGKTPIDLLRQDRIEDVVAAARDYAVG